MSVQGPTPPASPQSARSPQGQADLGTALTPGGRDPRHGQARDSNPGQDDRFGRALQKAMAQTRPTAKDGPEDLPALSAAPLPLPPLPMLAPASLPAAEPARAPVDSIADRIDRYLRGAEGAQSLRQGEGMVVRLPANVLGVTEVSVKLQGDVLLVSIGIQAETAAAAGMQAQLALLGQALSLRQPRHSVRLALEDGDTADPRAETDRPFNPLMPKGRLE